MGIDHIIEKVIPWMDEYEAVIGVSEGEYNGKPCITVMTTDIAVTSLLPTEFEGVPVRVQYSTQIQAY